MSHPQATLGRNAAMEAASIASHFFSGEGAKASDCEGDSIQGCPSEGLNRNRGVKGLIDDDGKPVQQAQMDQAAHWPKDVEL